jgi:hypothetical protein
MLKFRESLISAHHNYLVNRMLSPGFLVGDPDSKEEFYFLADVVRPGEGEPRIYARLYDSQGDFVLEMEPKRIVESPLGCARQSFPGGYRIVLPSGPSQRSDREFCQRVSNSLAGQALRFGRNAPNRTLL